MTLRWITWGDGGGWHLRFGAGGLPLCDRYIPGTGTDQLIDGAWQSVPSLCVKPARTEGADGVLRCVQHDRKARGLSGKWTGPA